MSAATAAADPAKYGPWALIAGGSEGIGACVAQRLAGSGINLVLAARKTGPLEETAAEARAKGVQVRIVSVDLTAADMLERLRQATDDVEVGLLVYNAGASHKTGNFIDWPVRLLSNELIQHASNKC